MDFWFITKIELNKIVDNSKCVNPIRSKSLVRVPFSFTSFSTKQISFSSFKDSYSVNPDLAVFGNSPFLLICLLVRELFLFRNWECRIKPCWELLLLCIERRWGSCRNQLLSYSCSVVPESSRLIASSYRYLILFSNKISNYFLSQFLLYQNFLK